MKDDIITCSNCGHEITGETASLEPSQRKPCPVCDSTIRTIATHHEENIELRDRFEMKGKRPGMKKPIFEVIAGFLKSFDLGKLVHQERSIDRENKLYHERITDYETGEVIHECKEPLTDHKGHGKARKKKK